MNRLIKLLVAAAVTTFGFVGCGLLDNNPTDEDTVTITVDEIGAINGGDSKPLGGTIEGSPDPSPTGITCKILDSDSAEVSTDKISVSKNTPAAKKKYDFEDDLDMKIVTTSNACTGEYTLVITATAGSATQTKSKSFTIVNGKDCNGTPVTTSTLEAGANENTTLGSSIDLDGGSVWMSADAKNNVAEIDICYAHSGTANADKVGSAKWAKDSGFNFASSWTSPPDCKILSVTLSSTEFDAVETKEQITTLWADGTGSVNNLVVTQGDVFIVKTTDNVLAIARVDSQVAGTTGKITIKVAQ